LRFRGVNLLVPVGAKLILINPKKRIEQNGALFVVDRVSIAFSVNTEVWMEKESTQKEKTARERLHYIWEAAPDNITIMR
jgi:hypothetical protein